MKDFYYLNSPAGHELEITAKQREAIVSAMARGQKNILLNGNPLSLSGVSIFEEPKARKGMWFCRFRQWHGDGENCGCHENHRIDNPQEDNLLPSGKICKAKRSIHLEVAKRIKRDNPTNWMFPMHDKDARNFYRLEILEENDGEWCDFIAGTCVCHDEKVQTGTKWNEVFPDALNTLKEEA